MPNRRTIDPGITTPGQRHFRAVISGKWKNDKGVYLTTSKDTDGVIHVHTSEGKRILLPSILRHEVLQFAHISTYGGHFMKDRTRVRLEEIFRMRNMGKHVDEWIRACVDCGARKSRSAKLIHHCVR